ncbi:MAG: hypothetical protein K2Y21_11255 [Phycisphaerales bacterium]|nr:hypothetical protein [Phycisphaerales bacterium]
MQTTRVIFATALGLASLSAAASAQSITSIGVLPGDTISSAAAVNSNGQVVVGLSRTNATNGMAVRWVFPGTLTGLGFLPGGTLSSAAAVSPDGAWVVGRADATAGQFGFKWNQSTGIVALAPSGSIIQADSASGLDATGSIISGNYSALSGFGFASYGARWNGASVVGLSIPAGSIASGASGITPDGVYVIGDTGPGGGFLGLTYSPIARIWSNPSTYITLGTLPGGTTSNGRAISSNAQAATGAADVFGVNHAYRWSAGGGMEDLGLLPGAPVNGSSQGLAISADGLVVAGTATDSSSGPRAVISSVLGLLNLNTHLPTLGVNLTGWTLTECTGISADGTTLVGNGLLFGQQRGWVVRDIPPVCAPSIVSQPVSTSFCAGSFGFLQVLANPPHASVNLRFQWYKKVGKFSIPVTNGTTGGGSVIAGATSPILSFNPGFADVAGNYFCVVSGGCSDTSTFIVNVNVVTSAPIPGPAPLPLSICQNGSGGWVVTGTNPSAGPFTHQWYFESPVNSNNWFPLVDGSTSLSFGVPGGIVSGSTTSSFTIAAAPGNSLKAAHSTRYKCRVFNVCTFTDSPPGVLGICIGDTNCDGYVDDTDFVDFAYAYAIFDCADPLMPVGCPADMNGDGYVDDADFVLFAQAYENLLCP